MSRRARAGSDRSFGLSVGGMLCLIAAVLVWRGSLTSAQILGALGVTLVAFGLTFSRALTLVGFDEKPLVKFERLLTTYIACAPRGLRSYMMAMPLWLGDKLWMADGIRDELAGYEGDVLFGESR